MKKIEQEMGGVDFDWFAIDKSGNWAVFATAGEGRIPECVLKAVDLHFSISEKIELSNWGSSNIWSDYAAMGLFVFDWDVKTEVYLKKAAPNKSINFLPNIKDTAEFPNFEVEFNDVMEVKVKT